MKKPIKQTVGDFLAGRGFYIVLTACVAAVGVSGWYLMRELSAPAVHPAAGTAQVSAPAPSQSVRPSAVVPTVQPKPSLSPSPSPTVPASPSVPPSAAAWGKEVFTWPVKGGVIADFSLEVLAYDETMGDWRTHEGLDIAAEAGTKVRAVNAGTVTAVYEDDLMGTVITLAHEDGLASLYANLASQIQVEVGDVLDTGAVLGTVGQTAIAEVSRPSHLHFEMSQDGKNVDPANYLPQQ